MMTNGQHDELWMGAAKAIPDLTRTLKVMAMTNMLKELNRIGKIDDAEYAKDLLRAGDMIGFEIRIKEKEA